MLPKWEFSRVHNGARRMAYLERLIASEEDGVADDARLDFHLELAEWMDAAGWPTYMDEHYPSEAEQEEILQEIRQAAEV